LVSGETGAEGENFAEATDKPLLCKQERRAYVSVPDRTATDSTDFNEYAGKVWEIRGLLVSLSGSVSNGHKAISYQHSAHRN